ncbi:MAG: ribonuclease R, partial [Paracoccaceae bacterium]
SQSGMVIALGQRVVVKLSEAVPITGGLTLELVSIDGQAVSHAARRSGRGPVRRKAGKAKIKAGKLRKKVSRSRS